VRVGTVTIDRSLPSSPNQNLLFGPKALR